MSGNKNKGQGGTPSVPSTETTPAPLTPAPVAPDTVTAQTPLGTLAAEPFEPPLPIPPADPAGGAEVAREQLEKLGADQKKLAEEREALQKEREALAEAREQLEKDREALRRGEVPEEAARERRIVEVRALVGVVDPLRIAPRQPGETFRMHDDQAEDYEDRGLVEIL